VDNFFGGSGQFHTKIEGREFTTTEMRVVRMMLDDLFKDLTEAWSPVMPVEFNYINSEVNPHFANIVSPTEVVISVSGSEARIQSMARWMSSSEIAMQ